MMKDLGGMMKQVQAMQENVKRAQEEIANLTVTGQSGGGMVRIELTGTGLMKKLHLDESLLTGDECEILEDLIMAAFNDAKAKADKAAQEKMQAAAGGLGDMLPPGMKLPL